ncbi:MAG: HAD-IA family hydrolase [Dyella sp.]
MHIKAIIFDCDGTLVDSEILANEVLVEYLAELGFAWTVSEAVQAYTGVKMAECIMDLERRFNTPMPADFIAVFRQRMKLAFADRLRPMHGARELLASLRLPVHIASSGPREKIINSLRVTGLESYFTAHNAIFSAYEIGHWKPDPAFYRSVVKEIGIEIGEAIVVEDSEPGIRSAVGAGIATIALGDRGDLAGDLSRAMPAANLAEVGVILQKRLAPGA